MYILLVFHVLYIHCYLSTVDWDIFVSVPCLNKKKLSLESIKHGENHIITREHGRRELAFVLHERAIIYMCALHVTRGSVSYSSFLLFIVDKFLAV